MRFLVAALVAASLALLAVPAGAQPSPAVEADAERRFEEGKQLLRAGKVTEACAAFAESDALDPGIGVMMVLAACHEQVGRVASAHRAFTVAADRARMAGDPREATARASAEALVPKIPTIVVRAAGSTSISATVDGAPIAIGAPVRVDPGEHQLVVTAAGRDPLPLVVTLATMEQKEVVLTFDGQAQVTTVPVEPAAPPPRVAPSDGRTQRVLGWVVVGVGGAGLALGAGAGLSALGQKADLEEDPACPDACRDEDAVDAYNGMRTLSTIGFLAGAAVLGTGIVLVLTAPDGEEEPGAPATGLASTSVALGPSSAVVRGSFW